MLLILFTVLAMSGCARKVVFEKPIIKIVNGTNEEVKLLVKKCDEKDDAYIVQVESLPSKGMARNHYSMANVVTLELTRGCYDVKALSKSDGHMVGQQRGMNIPPEVYWVLK